MLPVVAFLPLLAGLGAPATPFLWIERARATVDWWSQLGSGFIRLSVIPLVVNSRCLRAGAGKEYAPAAFIRRFWGAAQLS